MTVKIHKKGNANLNFFCLTNLEKCAIIIKLSDENERQRKDTTEKFQKSLKKDLTNKRKCGIINKSVGDKENQKSALHLEK